MQTLGTGLIKTRRNSDILNYTSPVFQRRRTISSAGSIFPLPLPAIYSADTAYGNTTAPTNHGLVSTSRVMTPYEAMERVRAVVDRNENISVIGIAGPGDPLANEGNI